MNCLVLLVVVAFVSGVHAIQYTTGGTHDLKTAVNACLSNDSTGQSCNMGSWDVSSVTSMMNMFNGKGDFNADISAWDTSSVTNMKNMFYAAGDFNANISAWNTSSVTDIRGMFHQATSFNANISVWDTSSVTEMGACFIGRRRSTRHLCVGHQLCDGHGEYVLRGDVVQRGHLCVGHELCHEHV